MLSDHNGSFPKNQPKPKSIDFFDKKSYKLDSIFYHLCMTRRSNNTFAGDSEDQSGEGILTKIDAVPAAQSKRKGLPLTFGGLALIASGLVATPALAQEERGHDAETQEVADFGLKPTEWKSFINIVGPETHYGEPVLNLGFLKEGSFRRLDGTGVWKFTLDHRTEVWAGPGFRIHENPEISPDTTLEGALQFGVERELTESTTAEMTTRLLFGKESTMNWQFGLRQRLVGPLIAVGEVVYEPNRVLTGGAGIGLEKESSLFTVGVNCGRWYGHEAGPGCNVGFNLTTTFPLGEDKKTSHHEVTENKHQE